LEERLEDARDHLASENLLTIEAAKAARHFDEH